jgi:hypothetical protein
MLQLCLGFNREKQTNAMLAKKITASCGDLFVGGIGKHLINNDVKID